jgi:hypothetical protein
MLLPYRSVYDRQRGSVTVDTRLEIPRSVMTGGGSVPYYAYDLCLRSRPAQHIARRHLRAIAHAAYVIGTILSGADRETDDDGAGEWVDAIMAEAVREMGERLASWRTVADRHGLVGIADHAPAMTMTVEVSTPHLMAYIGLLGVLDDLSVTADALVAADLVTPGERTDTIRYWREQVTRTGRDLIRIAEEHRGRTQGRRQ